MRSNKVVMGYSALVFSMTFCFSFTTYGQAPVEITTDNLPNAEPPQAPPAVQKVRIENLLSQISSLKDLSSVYAEDLNSEEVQTEIVEKNPVLMMKLPRGVKLQQKSMDKMAKRYYRYDYFLPIYLRSQESVKKAFKQNAVTYTKDFHKFLEQATKYLHEGKSKTLIHPDFFYDSTFVFVYQHTCSQPNNNIGFRGNLPPGFEQYLASRGMQNPQAQTSNNDRKEVFDYIRTIGTFTKQQRDLFISKHPSFVLNFDCYPADFLIDDKFVSEMNNRFPHANFVETAYTLTKKESLKATYIDRLIKKISNDYRFPANLNEVKVDDWNDPALQAWLFENPAVIKLIDPSVKFDKTLLEKFLKGQYKPERYFSEAQKNNAEVTELLKKYPNDSEEHIALGKEVLFRQLEKIKCCGPSYSTGLANFVNEMPEEFISDDAYIISTLIKIRSGQEYLLNAYEKRQAVRKETKDYILSHCNEFFGISSWFHGRAPNFVNSDPEFKNNLEKSCKR